MRTQVKNGLHPDSYRYSTERLDVGKVEVVLGSYERMTRDAKELAKVCMCVHCTAERAVCCDVSDPLSRCSGRSLCGMKDTL
jgi:hypothetical protein